MIVLTVGAVAWMQQYSPKAVHATTFSWGARGDTVRQIQTKLKQWGYYNANVDGIYGVLTWRAVRAFQQKNGLKVDGVAGPQTLRAIGINVAQPTQTAGGRAGRGVELHMLARAIHSEARGEPYIGQVAVGAVVLNRVEHPSFPNTVAGVVYQPGAFTAVADGQINLNPEESSIKAARDALNGWDPTYGCIYYYNPAKTTNQWIYSRQVMLTIGKHKFAK